MAVAEQIQLFGQHLREKGERGSMNSSPHFLNSLQAKNYSTQTRHLMLKLFFKLLCHALYYYFLLHYYSIYCILYCIVVLPHHQVAHRVSHDPHQAIFEAEVYFTGWGCQPGVARFKHTLTPTGNLEQPISLSHMSLDCGKKRDFLKEIHPGTGRTCKLCTERQPGPYCCETPILTIAPYIVLSFLKNLIDTCIKILTTNSTDPPVS